MIIDLTRFGRCSITVSLPIISAMGLQCCPVPTAIFSNHSAFDSYFRADFTPHLDDYCAQWDRLGLRFDGIATGFLGSEAQIDCVERFLARFRAAHGVVLVDPVMGDHGKLYTSCTPALARRMAQLVRHANLVTPNLTEACVLTATEYDPSPSEANLVAICRKICDMGPKQVVISGLDYGDEIGNFIYEKDFGHQLLRVARVGGLRCGTGDAFAAILIANAVLGKPLAQSVAQAAQFIAVALRKTDELRVPPTDGRCFEPVLHML